MSKANIENIYFFVNCEIYIRYQDVDSMQSDCSDTGQTASHPWLCSHVATAQSRPGPCLIVSPFVSTCHSPVFSPYLAGILRGYRNYQRNRIEVLTKDDQSQILSMAF